MYDLDDVDRIEVIDASGRSYVTYEASHVDLALQDGGRTLKVFHDGAPLRVPAFKHRLLLHIIQGLCEGVATNTGDDSLYAKGVEDMAATILRILKHRLEGDDE